MAKKIECHRKLCHSIPAYHRLPQREGTKLMCFEHLCPAHYNEIPENLKDKYKVRMDCPKVKIKVKREDADAT